MATEFNYKPKNLKLSDFTSFAIALALIFVPIFMPFNIGFKRTVLVPYPYSMYLLIIIGVALIAYHVMRLRKEAKLREAARPIIVDGDNVSFVEVSSKGIEERSIKISQVSNVDYDAQDEILTVTAPTGRFKFDCDYFDSPERFAEFRKIFEK